MVSKNLYYSIIFYVLLILLSCIVSVYGYLITDNIAVAMVGIFITAILVILLIRYLNMTNRRLSHFVDSIRNHDTSVKFPTDIRNKAVLDLYNNLNIINGIIRDTKIEVAYNEKLLQTMIEYSSSGFIMIDGKGDFQVMNNTARKYLDVEYTSNLNRLKQWQPGLHHLLNSLNPGETKIHRIEIKGQHIYLSVSLAVIKYYDKEYRIVSLNDITKELEEQELEAWHKLFRVITHEIMNSIAPITSLSQTLTRLYSKNGATISPEEINQKMINDTLSGLKVIDNMSHGLMSFVKNYRQLSKIPHPKIDKISIKPWLSKLKPLLIEMTNNQNIELKITVRDNCHSINSDEKLLNQVILNLVKNSTDALENKTGGEIQIQVYKTNENQVILLVSDNGVGISKDDMDKIFVPFFTTKENGNGIGLSLSKQIMQKLGGGLTVRSKEGLGTEARLRV